MHDTQQRVKHRADGAKPAHRGGLRKAVGFRHYGQLDFIKHHFFHLLSHVVQWPFLNVHLGHPRLNARVKRRARNSFQDLS